MSDTFMAPQDASSLYRAWREAEWMVGETVYGRSEASPPHRTFTLAFAVKNVLYLHQPMPIYAPCGHDHTEDFDEADAFELESGVISCPDGYQCTVCAECCTEAETQTNTCQERHLVCWPCETANTITNALDGAQ